MSVPENIVPGAVIAHIRASDRDSGTFGTEGIRFTRLSGPMAKRLSLDPVTGTWNNGVMQQIRNNRHFHRHYFFTFD